MRSIHWTATLVFKMYCLYLQGKSVSQARNEQGGTILVYWLLGLLVESETEAMRFPQTIVNFYQTARRHIPED
jgi:hypothetical protein